MRTLLQRMAPLCLCASALTFMSTAAIAGNGSLFSSDAGLFGGAPARAQPSDSMSLLQAGSGPSRARAAAVRNDPQPEVVPASTGTRRDQFTERDLNCLAEAIYHEARGESVKGQAAVAEVVLNRVDSNRFASSVCGVVNQPKQFSYTIGGRKPIRNKSAYLRAREIAREALAGAPRMLTGGATYFHTPAVSPSWAHRFQRTVRIGQHIFYRPGGQRVASN
ncbi:cell wall hydrolase [Paracoccus subflavus]|nr:cell wall hydrolase [Paracoccus subflavus]